MKTLSRILLYFLLLISFLPWAGVSGDTTFNPSAFDNEPIDSYRFLEPLPSGVSGSPGDTIYVADVSFFLQNIFRLAIALLAVVAVVMIIIGGFEYMIGESLGTKEAGRKKIEQAIGGFFLLLSTYLILFTINPELVNLNLAPGKVDINSSSATPTTILAHASADGTVEARCEYFLKGRPDLCADPTQSSYFAGPCSTNSQTCQNTTLGTRKEFDRLFSNESVKVAGFCVVPAGSGICDSTFLNKDYFLVENNCLSTAEERTTQGRGARTFACKPAIINSSNYADVGDYRPSYAP